MFNENNKYQWICYTIVGFTTYKTNSFTLTFENRKDVKENKAVQPNKNQPDDVN